MATNIRVGKREKEGVTEKIVKQIKKAKNCYIANNFSIEKRQMESTSK